MASQTILCICGRGHRTYKAAAWCQFPKAWWVTGEGPYAILARCGNYSGRGGLTVTLWKRLVDAERILANLSCGGQCVGDHEIIEVHA